MLVDVNTPGIYEIIYAYQSVSKAITVTVNDAAVTQLAPEENHSIQMDNGIPEIAQYSFPPQTVEDVQT